jgi:hypothetical protein
MSCEIIGMLKRMSLDTLYSLCNEAWSYQYTYFNIRYSDLTDADDTRD